MKLRRLLLVPVVIALNACATATPVPNEAARAELTPTGKLRFGVVAGVERTEFFVVRNADGQLEGVPVQLARELARRLGAPVEFKVASSPLELTEMLLGGKIDSAIMPPDKWGRQRVDFGTFYFVDRDAYMVPRGSRLKMIDEAAARGLAFAVPKNRFNALDYVAIFTEYAKASGLVQRAFDHAGLKNSQPAKPDSTAPVFWSFAPFLFGLDAGGLGELREHRDFLAG